MTSAVPSRTPRVSVPPHSQESRAQANADLSARMLRGVYSYPLMMSVLAVATDSFQQHPRLMWSTTLVLAGALVARLGLIIGRHYLYPMARLAGPHSHHYRRLLRRSACWLRDPLRDRKLAISHFGDLDRGFDGRGMHHIRSEYGLCLLAPILNGTADILGEPTAWRHQRQYVRAYHRFFHRFSYCPMSSIARCLLARTG